MQTPGLVVKDVDLDSIAAELGVEQGDTILQVNGTDIEDIIDYKFYCADENLQVLVQKNNGEQWLLEIEKDFDETLGVNFDSEGIGRTRRCQNKCIFCFVDQMPAKMRPSLYVKDDDYRLSFAQGNFITLTNTGTAELDRIARMRMSPMYVSIHTTNPDLRPKMMGHARAGRVMDQLQFLAQAGIEMHTQAVLCPGINDGDELERTIGDLGSLWPAVRSLAVVPVGLTAYRRGLFHLRPYQPEEARAVVDQVHRWQKIFQSQYEYPLVFASDEFYLTAGVTVPSAARYGGFPQTENGVGLVRLFKDQWSRARRQLPGAVTKPLRLAVVTGSLAGPLLQQVVDELNCIDEVEAVLYVLKNNFFGHNVTVAGLLTGQDLIDGLTGHELGDKVFIPSVMLREGESTFLDDVTVEELSRRFGVPVIPVDGPKDIVREMVR
ncbi:MAG TPA: radical SAM protein [Desulfotomaculum sp.]|nr:MAG: Fe-S oxidoreductase [Desulfotomaculum sp. BICA1-6]HBX24318.1 radical SAM protein [Desulfotomaculum sp.]